jgi:2-amino-4-hydroxy-6-hydroxymethyldihydropteridine diphosphokinase
MPMSVSEPNLRPLVALSLGANLGDRETSLAVARYLLAAGGALHILKASSLYETEPVQCPPQPWFLNQVLWVTTALPPALLLSMCQDVERRLGRHRRTPKGARTIDVDLLFYGNTVVRTAVLELPHPALALRRSALVPLVELGVPWRHPTLGLTPPELLARCPDPGRVVMVIPEIAREG